MAWGANNASQHDFVVITIDSGSVGLAVIQESKEDKIPVRRVIFKSRETIIQPETVTLESFQQATQAALTKVLQAVMAARIKVPRDVHVVLSSPWQSSQTRFVASSKDKTYKITQKVIHELMQKEEAAFVAVAKQNPALFGADFVLFESKTMSATLNGYPIEEPIGKSAKTVELVLHMSVASRAVLTAFTESVQSEITHAKVSFHSSVFTYFAQLRDIFSETKSFLIIEVSEILSEVTIVENAALSQSVSFPGGFHTQTETIAKELGRTIKEVAMYTRMYRDGTLEQSLQHTFEDALKIATKNWAALFGQALASLSKEVIVPDAIFLVTSGGDTTWILEAVKSEALQDFTIASHAFTFLNITPEHFNDFIKPVGEAGHDVPLELSALYVSTKT